MMCNNPYTRLHSARGSCSAPHFLGGWELGNLRILVVDDDETQLEAILLNLGSGRLADQLRISTETGAVKSLERVAGGEVDLLLSDLHMPEMDGLQLLQRAQELQPGMHVIIVTGDDDISAAVECLKHGALDYLKKPLDFGELELRIERLMEGRRIKEERDSLRSEIKELQEPGWELRLPSPGMQRVRAVIEVIKDSDFPVLILGESGTGKEIVANAIHRCSGRAGAPFVKVNCAGLTSTFIESELFGHEKGAYTGANTARMGKFERAEGGTLFLDEIGDLELGIQAKLLRVLQDGNFETLGGSKLRHADTRIIAATNRDLLKDIGEGKFREDLYHRLNVIRIEVPPLRERRQDIPILAMRFLDSFSRRYGRRIEGFDHGASLLLESYAYPGNVRELENAVASAFAMCRSSLIQAEDLPEGLRVAGPPAAVPSNFSNEDIDYVVPEGQGAWELEPYLAHFEERRLRAAIDAAGGNRSLAAEWLGISRRSLYDRLGRYGIGT